MEVFLPFDKVTVLNRRQIIKSNQNLEAKKLFHPLVYRVLYSCLWYSNDCSAVPLPLCFCLQLNCGPGEGLETRSPLQHLAQSLAKNTCYIGVNERMLNQQVH